MSAIKSVNSTKFLHESGFTSIDNNLFYVQSVISASAFSLLVRIFRATHGYGEAVKALSGVYLQKTTNLSKNTITKATKELEEIGVLLVKRRARMASYYQISVNGVKTICDKVKDDIAKEMNTLEKEVEEIIFLETKLPCADASEESIVDAVEVPEKDGLNTSILDTGFGIFWSVYDKRILKSECRAQWGALTSKDHREIMKNLEDYVTSTPDKTYRKDPINYLKGKCWEDEIIQRVPNKKAVENNVSVNHSVSVEEKVSAEDRDVVKVGSVADSKINSFLKNYGRKGK